MPLDLQTKPWVILVALAAPFVHGMSCVVSNEKVMPPAFSFTSATYVTLQMKSTQSANTLEATEFEVLK